MGAQQSQRFVNSTNMYERAINSTDERKRVQSQVLRDQGVSEDVIRNVIDEEKEFFNNAHRRLTMDYSAHVNKAMNFVTQKVDKSKEKIASWSDFMEKVSIKINPHYYHILLERDTKVTKNGSTGVFGKLYIKDVHKVLAQ